MDSSNRRSSGSNSDLGRIFLFHAISYGHAARKRNHSHLCWCGVPSCRSAVARRRSNKISDISLEHNGAAVKLGAIGLDQIIEIKLTPEEKAGLDKSAAAVKGLCGVIGV